MRLPLCVGASRRVRSLIGRVAPRQPFVLAASSSRLEVRMMDPLFLIQTLPLPQPRLFARAGDAAFVASSQFVWRLVAADAAKLVESLVREGKYEPALSFVPRIRDLSEEGRVSRTREIRMRYAYGLFAAQRYRDALALFNELRVDPRHVIALYPNFLPAAVQRHYEVPADLPPLGTLPARRRAATARARWSAAEQRRCRRRIRTSYGRGRPASAHMRDAQRGKT